MFIPMPKLEIPKVSSSNYMDQETRLKAMSIPMPRLEMLKVSSNHYGS